jgi:leucine-zipper of insertion element IS481
MRLFTRSPLERMGVAKPTVLSERRLRVKLHPNAKTTPHMRALLVHRVRTVRWRVADAAAAAGIAIRTAYKWLARHRQGGDAALVDRSSAPHRQPRRTAAAVVSAIVAARQERLTAWEIAVRLQVPRSTVAAILARLMLNRLTLLEPAAPRRARACRYQTAWSDSARRPPDSSHATRQRRRGLGICPRRRR